MSDPIALTPLPLAPGERGVRIAPIDIAWLRMDEPENRMHVHGVLVLAGDLSGERLARQFERSIAALPRFRQRVALERGRYLWVDDADFDLARHATEQWLPAPGDDAELAAAISEQFARPFDRRHPLWEFRAFRGYRGGDTALFGRLHHAIGDGVALMSVLLAMADPERTESGGETNPFLDLFLVQTDTARRAAHAAAERWMPETMRLMQAPVEAFARLGTWTRRAAAVGSAAALLATRSEPATRFKGPLSVAKRVAWTEPLALERIKEIGRAAGATVNELLNATMAGALRRYLAASGPVPTRSVRCAMPVNLRPIEEMAALGNRFGLAFLPLPVELADPLARLAALREASARLKRSAQPLMVMALLDLAGRLPLWAEELLIRVFGSKATAVFSNVPGPRSAMHLAGHEVVDLFFWVPQAGRLGLGVSIFSYCGKVRMGVATDAALAPDPERIVAAFDEEWRELVARIEST